MYALARSRENHSPRSTSGISNLFPERGGHSISQVLLARSEGSQFPAKAQALTSLPLFCRTVPRSTKGGVARKPVFSLNSRWAAASGSSPALNSPFGIVHEPLFFFAQIGPPGVFTQEDRTSSYGQLHRRASIAANPNNSFRFSSSGALQRRTTPNAITLRSSAAAWPFSSSSEQPLATSFLS